MAKPRIFISSTFYDLRQIRSDLDLFIENLGFEPIRNEEGDIPFGKELELEEYCYKEIKSVDILICIIGGRFGSESKNQSSSITQSELKTALKEKKQVYIFIEKSVLAEYETYLLNKQNTEIKYRYIDDIRIFQFIEEIKNLNSNNNIKGFETAHDITKYLKEQLAGLFQYFLEQQTKIKEFSLVENLERTSNTLNKLVTFLAEQNKGHEESINKILMINHPLISSLRSKLRIPYNFYIESIEDLKMLIGARGFIEDTASLHIDNEFYVFQKTKNDSIENLLVSTHLFDSEGKLLYFNKGSWSDDFLRLTTEKPKVNDDLPF